MAAVDLCCLANSRKLQGRCVAGIDLATGRWIRPVSRLEFRILTYRHYQLPPPMWETKVLDQVRIPLEKSCPECHHPEDCYVGSAAWELLHRPATPAELKLLHDRLQPFLAEDEYLFGTPEDRISYETFKSTPAAASPPPRWRSRAWRNSGAAPSITRGSGRTACISTTAATHTISA